MTAHWPIPGKFSGEDIDFETDGGTVSLFDIEWDFNQDIIGENERDGYIYGEPYDYVFEHGYIGSFKVTREALVAMSSEARVQMLEDAKNEK